MINGKYHTERICKGEKIVIDIAEICGRYEIAVLGKGGKELEMETVRTIEGHTQNRPQYWTSIETTITSGKS